MACGTVDGAGHGERGWPARAGAGWGASIGEAAVSPGRPPAASASVTPHIFGAPTRPAPRRTVMHKMLGNWDVDNDPAVGNAGERASRMLVSSADQRDGSNFWGISVHRQAAEEGDGGHINLRGSAVDLVWCMSRYRKNFGRFQKPQELVLRRYNLYSRDRNTIFNGIQPSPKKN